jgi:hypothetical protein
VVVELGVTEPRLVVEPAAGHHATDGFLAGALGAGARAEDVALGPSDDLRGRFCEDFLERPSILGG